MGKHSEWRKLAKKARRKRIRQRLAQERHDAEEAERKRQEQSPTYIRWQKDQQIVEEQQAEEEIRLAKEAEEKWLNTEEEAQKQWQELRKKLELARDERAKQNELIKAEWEREQSRLKEIKEIKIKEAEEQQRRADLLKDQIENFIQHGGGIPEQLNVPRETNPNKQLCTFFQKTGTCRFSDTCSRNHIRPGISRVILLPNFYSHISLEQSAENEYNTDSLEFEVHEVLSHFKNFFYDVFPEFEKYGKVTQFKVCSNQEPHLRGNVYVEYSSCREALQSYQVFQGRWYGGKQLNVEFCAIESWKAAICGLNYAKACPKGSACNFLHTFRNPGNMFYYADRDLNGSPCNQEFESHRGDRNWRWSESPERLPLNHYNDKYSDDRHRRKTRENGRHHKSRRRSRSKSKSTRRRRSRSSSRSHKRSRLKSDRSER